MLWGRINDHISYICWILQQFMNIELEISRWEGRKQSPVHVRSWSSEYDMIKAFIVGKYDEVDFRYGWLNYKANHGDPTKVLDTNWMWVIQWSKDSSSKSVTSLTGSWIATENSWQFDAVKLALSCRVRGGSTLSNISFPYLAITLTMGEAFLIVPMCLWSEVKKLL